MYEIIELIVIFGFCLIALVIIGITTVAIKFLKGGVSRKDRELQADETGKIQQIYVGLSKMEDRVEALETLLLDKERKDKQ